MRLSLLGAVLMASLVAVAALNAGEAQGDQDKIRGKWDLVEVREGGAVQKPKKPRQRVVEFDADKVRFDDGTAQEYLLNPRKKPKEIDVKLSDDEAHRLVRGIYQLDGDELKICVDLSGKRRPAAFESKKGSEHRVLILKRLKS